MNKPYWFDPLVEYGFHMHALLGNHDITLRESLSINTPESMLQDYIKSGHLTVYKEPTVVNVDSNTTFDIIPWICQENQEAVMAFMNRKKASDLCLGHFEIQGASMYKGIPGHGGLSQDLFERYEATLSGHYHTRSFLNDGKINYVGTPYELTWMDANDPRGFTVFDTVTRKFEFIQNQEVMFKKVYYRGNNSPIPEGIEEKYVKLIVERKDDIKDFDAFLNSVRLLNPFDLAIIENHDDLVGGNIGDDGEVEIEDTLTIIANYIDSLQTSVDKDKVKSYINGLYAEGMSV